jgi:heme/copper-type cytochrome/quinol oxidase subunit 2
MIMGRQEQQAQQKLITIYNHIIYIIIIIYNNIIYIIYRFRVQKLYGPAAQSGGEAEVILRIITILIIIRINAHPNILLVA